MLELMASQNATLDNMFSAAKYVNALWFPQQMLEVATVLKATQNVDFTHADARQVVSNKYSSGSGYQAVHQWLASNGFTGAGSQQRRQLRRIGSRRTNGYF